MIIQHMLLLSAAFAFPVPPALAGPTKPDPSGTDDDTGLGSGHQTGKHVLGQPLAAGSLDPIRQKRSIRLGRLSHPLLHNDLSRFVGFGKRLQAVNDLGPFKVSALAFDSDPVHGSEDQRVAAISDARMEMFDNEEELYPYSTFSLGPEADHQLVTAAAKRDPGGSALYDDSSGKTDASSADRGGDREDYTILSSIIPIEVYKDAVVRPNDDGYISVPGSRKTDLAIEDGGAGHDDGDDHSNSIEYQIVSADGSDADNVIGTTGEVILPVMEDDDSRTNERDDDDDDDNRVARRVRRAHLNGGLNYNNFYRSHVKPSGVYSYNVKRSVPLSLLNAFVDEDETDAAPMEPFLPASDLGNSKFNSVDIMGKYPGRNRQNRFLDLISQLRDDK